MRPRDRNVIMNDLVALWRLLSLTQWGGPVGGLLGLLIQL